MSVLDLDIGLLTAHISQVIGEKFRAPEETVVACITGGEYHILMLTATSHTKRISVRIPKAPPSAITSSRLELEVDIRRRIDAAKLQRFQPLLAYDSTANNPIHRPFMVLGWANGTQLQWSSTIPKCPAQREAVLEDIANASLDLLLIHQPGVTAREWMLNKINRKIARADANQLPFGTKAQCEQQKSLIQKYWVPSLDNSPHVLVHGDLSCDNIIVDESLAVQSVIDLGWAEMVPLQYAAEYPRIVQIEPVETSCGFRWTATEDTQMQKDRLFYLSCIKHRAEREGGLALSYYQMLSRTDELNRYWWYAATSRSDAHRAMVQCDWSPLSVLYSGASAS